MDTTQPPTIVAAFRAIVEADPTRPLVTFYDDASGERVDLSGASLDNWVAKTANLLMDGHGLGPGDVVAVHLPPHWQTAAVLLGCWTAGVSVALPGPAGGKPAGPGPAAGLSVGPGPVGPGPVGADAALAFVTVDQRPAADEVYALALAPMAAPLRPGPPPGTLDYVVEVRGYGDHCSAPPVRPTDVALADGTTHAALAGTGPWPERNGRVLIDGGRLPDPARWLVAPLIAGCSIVICVNLDPARVPTRLAAERAVAWP